jgi:hypothetical protein
MKEWPQVGTEIVPRFWHLRLRLWYLLPRGPARLIAEFNQLDMTMDLCLDLCRATDRFRIGMLWWRDLVGLQPGSVIVQRAAKRLHAGKTTELTCLRDARVCLVRANLLLAGQGEQHCGRSRR